MKPRMSHSQKSSVQTTILGNKKSLIVRDDPSALVNIDVWKLSANIPDAASDLNQLLRLVSLIGSLSDGKSIVISRVDLETVYVVSDVDSVAVFGTRSLVE
jgi:hypothetical protein